MTVARICVCEVDTASPHETVQVAAQRMHDRKVGILPVIDSQRRPLGVLTDRDLAVRVVAKGADPYSTTVEQVMTASVRTVHRTAPIEDALSLMRAGACRRLLVVDDNGQLQGLVSLDDMLGLLAAEFADIGRLIERESPAALVSR